MIGAYKTKIALFWNKLREVNTLEMVFKFDSVSLSYTLLKGVTAIVVFKLFLEFLKWQIMK